MSGKKNSSSALVSGLGMAMAFIQVLVNEIVEAGGFEEMLHPLASDHGKGVVKELAKVIVGSQWQVPRSLIERLAVQESQNAHGGDYVENDMRFFWDVINLRKVFRIPVIRFSNEAGDNPPIPPEVLSQITQKVVQYPLLIEWKGEPYVLVSITEDNGQLEVGKVPDFEINSLSIAPAKFFALDR